MKKLPYIFLICNLQFAFSFCFGQDRTIDSLKLALKKAKHDTTRCNILFQLAETAPDGEWQKFNQKLQNLAELNLKILKPTLNEYNIYKKHEANSLNNFGLIYFNQGDITKALNYFVESLIIRKEIGDKNGIANSQFNIASNYYRQGNIEKALEYYRQSLKIHEEIGNKQQIAILLTNIGVVYRDQADVTKALEYYTKSLNILQEIGNKEELGILLNNIGVTYQDQLNIPKALEYYFKSLKIHEDILDKNGIANVLYNIGFVYKIQNDISKAFNYFDRSLKIQEEIGNKRGITNSLTSIGAIYLKQKNYSNALIYCSKSMRIAKGLAFPENIRNAANQLTQIYKATGDYKNALINYELFIQMRDSINNQETKKASIKSQLKYEYEKKAAADSVLIAEEKKLTSVKLKQEKTQRYYLYGGLGLTVLFGIFMFNRFRITQKQKNIINEQKTIVENQKHIVEEKQKEILDSIRYAKRIQTAFLPSEKYIERIIKKNFKN